tara:strand:- start:2406 stop:2927 length:522 start_codon:yes stop_codon:yes gene_type:complete
MEQENKYTKEEVALHNTKEDCWIIINNGVYDVTDFISIHPGGASILASQGGKDATEFFEELHRPEIIDEVASDYKIGILSDSEDMKEDINTQRIITREELAKHRKKDDCWLSIDGKVYDLSEFILDHPGGPEALLLYSGKDATKEFRMIHHPDIIKTYDKLYHIGSLEETSML